MMPKESNDGDLQIEDSHSKDPHSNDSHSEDSHIRVSQINDLHRNDEQQILALHEAGDRALMSADLAALARLFADDYIQYNEAGEAFTKQDVLNNFRTGAIRYPSIVSTGRKIRLFGDTAVVHGSESDEVEVNARRCSVRYVYLDVLRKRDGEWRLVASQLARPVE
jgi:uncharacterized protein (TIGR02246 family)